MFDAEFAELQVSMDALEALRELSGNSDQAIIAARTSERVEIKTKVNLRPGNASQRTQFVYHTVTADISDGGCMLLSPTPVMTGDIYWLQFCDDDVRIGSLFGRCMRSRYVSEGVYELGIKFMSPIDLKSSLAVAGSSEEIEAAK